MLEIKGNSKKHEGEYASELEEYNALWSVAISWLLLGETNHNLMNISQNPSFVKTSALFSTLSDMKIFRT